MQVDRFTIATAVSTVIIAGMAVVQAIIFWHQWKAMRGQLDAMQSQLSVMEDLCSAKTSAGRNLHNSWCKFQPFLRLARELCSAFLLCAKLISHVAVSLIGLTPGTSGLATLAHQDSDRPSDVACIRRIAATPDRLWAF
jgi:hypothetical protein